MTLYIFIVAFIMPNGDFLSGVSIVDSCPKMEQVIDFVKKQGIENGAKFWSAQCSSVDFAPFFQEELT
jgi:cobalamin biosynthesis Co2+ chelatase CbiK